MFSDFACLMIIFICSSNSKILLLSEMINILKLFQYSGIQVYAIANLGNTSYIDDSIEFFMELPAFFWNSTPFLLNHISRHKGVWKLEFNSQSKSPCYIAKKKIMVKVLKWKSAQINGQINVLHSCDGNSGFFHDLIFVAVLESDGCVWFIIGSVCKQC